MKYRIKNHNDHQDNDYFEIDKVEVINELEKIEENEESIEVIKEESRRKVALTILYTCILFLVCASLYGASDGSFNELSEVWSSMQIILGIAVGYYLGPKNG